MYVHNLNPVALEFFGLKIYWYSLAYLSGFIFSIFYSKLLIRKGVIDLDANVVDSFFSWAIIGIIFGGRLGYVIFYNFEVYIQNIIEIFKIWKGGMSFHGGLIGLIVSMYIFSRINKINFIDKPYTRFKGTEFEQNTFFVEDPNGNVLELKTFEQ